MTKLLDDEKAQNEIEQMLVMEYRNQIDGDYVRALLNQLDKYDAGAVKAAVTAHIQDSTPTKTGRVRGTFAPRIAELLGRLREKKQNSYDIPTNPYSTAGKKERPTVTKSIPAELQKWIGFSKMEVATSDCEHCADDGLVWYHTGPHEKELYITSSTREMPLEWFTEKGRVIQRNATCCCSTGRALENGAIRPTWDMLSHRHNLWFNHLQKS